ncbi:protein translocase subunit SecDF [Paludibacter sp. 221]|uniref:protein translocase subunit SecDF n=1 Tax=Paludibacter sp. 221 TaxID=2302939 RepID=UPI0013D3D03C|nr:protein translocase subunit SecDF [Paludibacter sp. 221]NDV47040.1 protein translocase subunit SecDF [Paludibacter sp. 221]
MLNKGLVRLFTAALTLVCLFYLSFTVVTATYSKKASEYANGDKMKEYQYLDSLGYEKVWLGYTLKECREKEINLGLDLKGGMNVTLEVSIPDVIRSLSGYNTTENFNKALALASERQKTNSNVQYLDLFVQAYTELDPQGQLAAIFSTFDLKDRISLNTPNDEVVKVLRSEIDGAVSNSFNVLRTRIDRFGVVQPNIQKLGNTGRILIELPGIKEPERVRKLLQGSANLEFWETYELNEIYSNLSEANRVLAEMQRATESAKAEETTSTASTNTANSTLDADSLALLEQGDENVADNNKLLEEYKKANPLFGLTQTETMRGYAGPLVGVVSGRDTAKVNEYLSMKQVREVFPRDLEFRWSVKPTSERGDMYELLAIKVTNRDGRAPLAGDVITNARADFSQGSAFANVSMSMNAEGSKTWARMTKDNIGKCIAIVLDGYVYSYPRVNTEISGGQSQITGNFTLEEAKDLANTLNSGKMPAPARIIQEDIVGPSLGEQAINSGLISFIIAFVLILLYMIFYYGLIPGLIADIALFANVFFLLGILASFSAVLTLPGIAGIVLTLGMAVDGNVLIYERIREEMRAGKNLKKAVQDGFGNAISAIIDANVTTVITGIILMIFGTGPIKGFANTLVIGTITSFITSVFLTRTMLQAYANRDKAKELPFTTNVTKNWFQNTRFNFIGKRKIGYIISLAMIVICIVSLFTRGLSLGIDFSGGRNYVVRFEQPVQTEEVRSLLDDAFEDAAAQVITIGSDNQVRISTKYKIDDNSESVDNEMETILYNSLQPLLGDNVTKEEFVQDYIQSSQKVGPTIADDIKRSAVFAVIFAILAIGLYVFIRFRGFGYSLGAIAGLTQDALITLGLYSLFYGIMPFSMEIDQSFIAAILTVVGYSVNDKVVIFDRIRENVRLYPKRERSTVINDSINATLSRTFSTSMSTLVVLIAIFIFGGETIRGFVFAMMFGIIIGTFSSIFLAAPIAYEYYMKKTKKAEAKAIEKK